MFLPKNVLQLKKSKRRSFNTSFYKKTYHALHDHNLFASSVEKKQLFYAYTKEHFSSYIINTDTKLLLIFQYSHFINNFFRDLLNLFNSLSPELLL